MRRAFSLIELLLSVFILAIGIISISALFPAGIAQQQLSSDDQLGPIIAEHAIGTLRSRVKQQDFGTFEEYQVFSLLQSSIDNDSYVYRPAPGDWSWIRPGIIKADLPGSVPQNAAPNGAMDVFSAVKWRLHFGKPPLVPNVSNADAQLAEFPEGIQGNGLLYGAPYNSAIYGEPPIVLVTQRERMWPALIETSTSADATSQYTWDVMFRRFGGRVQVGIFVYRVVSSGGGLNLQPHVSKQFGDDWRQPPAPVRRVLAATAGPASVTGAVGAGRTTSINAPQVRAGWLQSQNDAPYVSGIIGLAQGLVASDFPQGTAVTGTSPGLVMTIPIQNSWQMPGQWLIDSNGNVVKVAQGRRTWADPVSVRFTNPIPKMPEIQAYDDYERPAAASGADLVPPGVRAFFYVPAFDGAGNVLVPVYCTVRDL